MATPEIAPEENAPIINLLTGFLLTPGVPYVVLFTDVQLSWWMDWVAIGLWLYGITCLVSGTVGVWSEYVRKQDRATALDKGGEAAISFWFGLIKWAFIAFGAWGIFMVLRRLELGTAIVAVLLTAILFMLVAIYNQRARG